RPTEPDELHDPRGPGAPETHHGVGEHRDEARDEYPRDEGEGAGHDGGVRGAGDGRGVAVRDREDVVAGPDRVGDAAEDEGEEGDEVDEAAIGVLAVLRPGTVRGRRVEQSRAGVT